MHFDSSWWRSDADKREDGIGVIVKWLLQAVNWCLSSQVICFYQYHSLLVNIKPPLPYCCYVARFPLIMISPLFARNQPVPHDLFLVYLLQKMLPCTDMQVFCWWLLYNTLSPIHFENDNFNGNKPLSMPNVTRNMWRHFNHSITRSYCLHVQRGTRTMM